MTNSNQANIDREANDETIVVRTLQPGQVVKIAGIPFWIEGEASISGHEGNFEIPEVKAALEKTP